MPYIAVRSARRHPAAAFESIQTEYLQPARDHTALPNRELRDAQTGMPDKGNARRPADPVASQGTELGGVAPPGKDRSQR